MKLGLLCSLLVTRAGHEYMWSHVLVYSSTQFQVLACTQYSCQNLYIIRSLGYDVATTHMLSGLTELQWQFQGLCMKTVVNKLEVIVYHSTKVLVLVLEYILKYSYSYSSTLTKGCTRTCTHSMGWYSYLYSSTFTCFHIYLLWLSVFLFHIFNIGL